ncbi:MATE efflux family protein [Methylocella silvestris BL2]|uniref:MATE efflux family protein n=1 Tax=Methylocella silvestris (strain DSM 15510 / CIP 108128 / LMG 27833 / NCIMB 13906 / BL2) TaxID=395965 RepID=B8EQL4_METSB|nr:MATE family efflux transporter [Methylocella silvestris]ACK52227.1 MATE efflux family protein [Methylocella silvestris BL2]
MNESFPVDAPRAPEQAPASDLFLPKPVDLGDPRLRSLIMRLALPSVFGLSINALHQVVNAAFVGALGAEAIAAVTLALPIFIFISAVGHGLGVGAAASIGRLLGANEPEEANATATVALALAAPFGVACAAALLLWLTPILELFGATPTSAPFARAYIGVLAFGAPFMLLQILCDFIAIAEGNTRFSMWTLVGAFTLNIILDPILIFGFHLGVAGAAAATIASELAALAAFAFYFANRVGRLRIGAKWLRPRFAILRPIFSVGAPTSLSTALAAVSFVLIYRAAANHGGDAAIAGAGIALRLLTFGELPLVGFCLGAQAVLSYAFGAGQPARVVAATRFMLVVTTTFAAAYSLVILAFPHTVISLFTDDAPTRAMAVQAVVAFHAVFALSGLQLVTLVLLQSLDEGRLAGAVGLAPQGYLLIPLLVALPPAFGMTGVILSQPIAMALTAVLSAVLLWRRIGSLRREAAEDKGGADQASAQSGSTLMAEA